jgi:hypothetical protein
MSEIQETLQRLTEALKEIVSIAISSKTVEPEDEPQFKWKIRSFEYTDSGITSSAEGNYGSKKSWFRASVALRKQIPDDPSFKTALEELKQAYPAVSEMPNYLEGFAGTIVGICLTSGGAPDSTDIEKAITGFLRDLAGGPVTYKAKVELRGVTLRSERVPLDVGMSIRQPRKEDLESTIRADVFLPHRVPNPSAIVDIEFSATRGQNPVVQRKVQQCVALLRLFGVGSVNYTSYTMESDSIMDWAGHIATLTSGDSGGALETYVIKNEDEAKLKAFWRTMSGLMPKDIYDFQRQISHITLAYDRYSDALLVNGIIERRIANAVMGLEALLLDETQELSYRLGARASKLLGLMDKPPLHVRTLINDAYRIRSTFAHGGHLTYKLKKKLEAKYGETKQLLLLLLDYLRILIVTMILCHTDKRELIDLIDDALIDEQKQQQLKGLVSGAKIT